METDGLDLLGDSLLQWVRSFQGVGEVQQWRDLSDGRALWTILQDVDADYFTGALPEPDLSPSDDWTRRWQNLKHVDKQVSLYYRDICNGQEQLGANRPDLKAIAADSSVQDLERLLMAIIRSAMTSPESNQRMAPRLMGLGRERAMAIAGELRAMEESEVVEESEPASREESAYQSEAEAPEETKPNGSKGSSGLYSDPLLEREEELLQAQATIDKLQANHATAQRQLQELRQDKDRLQEAFDSFRDDIDSRGKKVDGGDAVKKLQRQADNDRAYIDDLEAQLQTSRNAVEKYERQIQKLRDDAEAGQKLRDDLQMLRAENEDLTQKIRANENLKKKIQALQEQERLNVSLRDELKTANEKLEELERMKQVQTSLEKEIIEKRGLIRNQEYQINELGTMRKHAVYDSGVLAQKLEAARERHERDHEAIEELRQKLQDHNLDDEDIVPKTDMNREITASEEEPKKPTPKTDESKHWAEKVDLLEKQLAASDTRLKQAAERTDALEEEKRNLQGNDAEKLKVQQLAQDQETRITELRKQLDAASKQPQTSVLTPDMATLQRENRLMASAWYDVTARLQNNGVSLGRRKQEPKSWIGKQRALVGPGSSMVRFTQALYAYNLITNFVRRHRDD
jgi:protein HOOK3